MYIIYNIFTQAEGAVRHLASREPDQDNNFGRVAMVVIMRVLVMKVILTSYDNLMVAMNLTMTTILVK